VLGGGRSESRTRVRQLGPRYSFILVQPLDEGDNRHEHQPNQKGERGVAGAPWQRLNLRPEPQRHGALRGCFIDNTGWLVPNIELEGGTKPSGSHSSSRSTVYAW
jgi:hypothetical protein